MAEQPYRLLLLNGPNLNLLGTREPTVYGQQTLAQIEQALTEQARAAGAELSTLQSMLNMN
jgi:3-dehydroquinate dehydratase-2